MSIVEKAVGKYQKKTVSKKKAPDFASDATESQEPARVAPVEASVPNAAPNGAGLNGHADAEPALIPAPNVARRKKTIVENAGARLLPVEGEPTGGRHGRAVPLPEESGNIGKDLLVLDFEQLREASIVPPEDLAPNLANEFRRIKRPLLKTAFGKSGDAIEQGNLIMLCSALSGEGKTFTSMNLAMSVALERERTVLLIDADVAKPHISTALGLRKNKGLMDLLVDRTLDISEVLVQTDMPGLRVLPAGTQHEYATELLASERMEELMAEIAGRYRNRTVILDSPPLLQTSEAQVLTGLVGQVVVVVHAGATPQSAVESALELIDPSKYVSLILNKSRIQTGGDSYYGSYYGQQYGQQYNPDA
ncbi:MAG: XrtA-associated tyrosine autokinase [Pseudomonadota bacterium]